MSRGSGYQRNGWAWQATVKRILQRDGGCCYLCGGRAITADHVVPVSQGGPHTDDNLAAICKPCHDIKSDHERRQGIERRRAAKAARRTGEPHPNHTGGRTPTPGPR